MRVLAFYGKKTVKYEKLAILIFEHCTLLLKQDGVIQKYYNICSYDYYIINRASAYIHCIKDSLFCNDMEASENFLMRRDAKKIF